MLFFRSFLYNYIDLKKLILILYMKYHIKESRWYSSRRNNCINSIVIEYSMKLVNNFFISLVVYDTILNHNEMPV
jgi:hypothetical protein